MPSGVWPLWNARITNSSRTRLLPTRKTPGGSSRSGTAIESGSNSAVVMVAMADSLAAIYQTDGGVPRRRPSSAGQALRLGSVGPQCVRIHLDYYERRIEQ